VSRTSPKNVKRFRSDASEHLRWCAERGIPVVGGRWDLEDPLTGLLLSSIIDRTSTAVVLSALCSQSWEAVSVSSAWWPSEVMDIIVNFEAAESPHSLVLEHKNVNSTSNAPGYRTAGGGKYWQTESLLREIERVREAGEGSLLGGPFDSAAVTHLVVLDALGRTMDEIFELRQEDEPHRHHMWTVKAYSEFASDLRRAYEARPVPGLVPLIGQMFAQEA
jgi:hypothetical protein